MDEIVVVTRGARETERLGECLGAAVLPGDLLLLRGSLGGGKTTFTRGLVSGTGHPDSRDVASPTFALHHRYEGGRVPVNHLDLYRLEASPALAVQGIFDALHDPDAATVVEWSERLPAGEAEPALEVSFSHRGSDERVLAFGFLGPRGRDLAGRLRACLATFHEGTPLSEGTGS